MKLLLLDDDYIILEQLKCLTQLDNGWELVDHNKVNYSEIDLVIIDIFHEKYNQILQDILKINPTIRTLVVSDKFEKKLDKDCEYCNKHYSRIRLIKPIKLKVLFNTIKNFDDIPICPLADAFSSLEKLLPIIIKQFKNLFYDEESRTIQTNSELDSKENTMQILSLLTLLDQNEIKYSILEDSSVQIEA